MMAATILVVIIGLIGGAAVGIQGPIAGAMGQRIGSTASSFIVHLSGLIASGLYLLLRGGERISEWKTLPWYMLASGIFGLILYLTINVTMPRLGGAMMVTLIIAGQLAIGMLVDHFGWLGVPVHPVNLARLGGLTLLMVGGYIVGKF
jgi:bacterial/archaeal transporter family-2 protein